MRIGGKKRQKTSNRFGSNSEPSMSKVTIWNTNVKAVATNYQRSSLRFEELEHIYKVVTVFILHLPAYFKV